MHAIEDVIAAKEEHSSRLLRPQARRAARVPGLSRTVREAQKNANRNLHAVGVGFKVVKGKRTKALCVRFYVSEKLPKSVLSRETRLPERIAGIPTDVIQTPQAVFHHAIGSAGPTTRVRPIIGGVSGAHIQVNRTTIGCLCRSKRRGEEDRRYILSCNHAFANLNGGPVGSPILQPSLGDGGRPADRVARLTRYVPMQFGGSQPNRVDAAIAEVMSRVSASEGICDIGSVTGVARPRLNMTVCKFGRTTRYTEGRVTDVSMDPLVLNYSGESALFVHQFRIEPTLGYQAPAEDPYAGWFAAPGDSGSIILAKSTHRAVGLHFSGHFGMGIANPMTEVCSTLDIEPVTRR